MPKNVENGPSLAGEALIPDGARTMALLGRAAIGNYLKFYDQVAPRLAGFGKRWKEFHVGLPPALQSRYSEVSALSPLPPLPWGVIVRGIGVILALSLGRSALIEGIGWGREMETGLLQGYQSWSEQVFPPEPSQPRKGGEVYDSPPAAPIKAPVAPAPVLASRQPEPPRQSVQRQPAGGSSQPPERQAVPPDRNLPSTPSCDVRRPFKGYGNSPICPDNCSVTLYEPAGSANPIKEMCVAPGSLLYEQYMKEWNRLRQGR